MLSEYFDKKREEFKSYQIPDNMEDSLRLTLEMENQREKIRSNRKFYIKLASFFLFGLLILSYNSNNIAELLYSKENLARYEDYKSILNGNINNFEEFKNFQIINQKLEFKDGGYVEIEGIFIDRLGLSVLLRKDKGDYGINIIDGKNKSGRMDSYGQESEDGKEEMMVYHIEGQIKREDIKLSVFSYNTFEEKEIKFKVDTNKIIEIEEIINLNKTIRYDGKKYKIKDILISPIFVRLDGVNENTLELGLRTIKKKSNSFSDIQISLEINGKVFHQSSSSFSTNMSGSYFSIRYDDFDNDIKSLDLIILDGKGQLIEKMKVR